VLDESDIPLAPRTEHKLVAHLMNMLRSLYVKKHLAGTPMDS
jgi:hypothetical protein